MLRIKNIHKIKGNQILIRGHRFRITDVLSDDNNYFILLDYHGTLGTLLAPITLLLRRESTFDVQNGVLRYALKTDTTTFYSYISLEGLRTPDEFVSVIELYLNNL